MKNNIWVDVNGYEGIYQISSKGLVARIVNGKRRLLKCSSTSNGKYKQAHLSKNNIVKGYLVHRLVAEHFIQNPNNYPCVNHKDENTENNDVSNLEWCDYTYNNNYGNHGKKISYTKSFKIIQTTIDGVELKVWKGISNASSTLNICRTSIQKCLAGKQNKAGGYRWFYESVQG